MLKIHSRNSLVVIQTHIILRESQMFSQLSSYFMPYLVFSEIQIKAVWLYGIKYHCFVTALNILLLFCFSILLCDDNFHLPV